MIPKNLPTLKIQKLTKDQFQAGLENNILDDTSIYLTPVEIKDYALKSELNIVKENLNKKIDSDNVYTKTEINGLISEVFHYQGSVDTFEELPNSANVGDVYNVKNANDENHVKAGDNVVWCEIDGIGFWDVLSGIVDLSAYATNQEVQTKLNEKANKSEIPSLEGLVKITDLSKVATSNNYLDLDNTPDVYSKSDINSIKLDLENTINEKVSKDDNARLITIEEVTKLSNIEENANNYSLPAATTSTLGGVKVGKHLGINENSELLVTLDWNTLESKPELYSKEAVNTLLESKQDTLEQYVQSINNKTGEVVLTYRDVGALPGDTVIPTVPENVSEFNNDAGYLTQHQDLSNYATLNITNQLDTDIQTLEGAVQLKDNISNDLIADAASIEKYPSVKAVVDSISLKQDKLIIDSTPTKDSSNLVSSGGIETAITKVREIAEGKCKSYVLDDKAALIDWLTNYADPEELKTGDVFLLREVNVPDYWWEPASEVATLEEYTANDIVISGKGAARILETTKVDLSEYALKTEIPTSLSQLNQDTNNRLVSDKDKENWNNKSNFSGNYSDLKGKPSKLSDFTNDLSGYITRTEVINLFEEYLAGYKLRIVDNENDPGQENYFTFIK